MSGEEEGRVLGVAEERVGMGLEDHMGGERDRVEVSEFGMGRIGALDRGSNGTPREGGCNVPGSLRLPIPRSEPLNQPSRDIIGSAAGNMDPDHFRDVRKGGDGFERRKGAYEDQG